MPNIQQLKRKARSRAEERGHRFQPNGFHSHNGTRATAKCMNCGAGVTVDVLPVRTFGEAIEQDCVEAVEGDSNA